MYRLVFISLFLASPAAADPVISFETAIERLAFAPADIADAGPMFGDGGTAVFFELTPKAEADFSDFTQRSIGIEVEVRLCGELLTRVVVQDRLSGRGLLPASGIEAADLLAEKLRGETACD